MIQFFLFRNKENSMLDLLAIPLTCMVVLFSAGCANLDDEMHKIGSCTVKENCVKIFSIDEELSLDCNFLSGYGEDGMKLTGKVTADTDRRCNGNQIGKCRFKGKDENADRVVMEQHYFTEGDKEFRAGAELICRRNNGTWSQIGG